ncbi:hypothetical protein [Thomasclavelia sp.]|uniref:hypothetical protein n=1 Tax=Thomasclavelia sp. TaxID=3025757 RepID=UPI0025D91CBE|nr:hypothetical protein [Thomasclavelia sp.]
MKELNEKDFYINSLNTNVDVLKGIYRYHLIFENRFNQFIKDCKRRINNVSLPRNKIFVSKVFSFYNEKMRDPSNLCDLFLAQTRMAHYVAKEAVKGMKINIPFEDVLTEFDFVNYGMYVESIIAKIFTDNAQENNNQYDIAGYIIQNRFSRTPSLERIETKPGGNIGT